MVYWLGLGSLDSFHTGSNPPVSFPFFLFLVLKSKFPAGSLLKSRLPVL